MPLDIRTAEATFALRLTACFNNSLFTMLLLRKICLYLFSFLGYQVFSSKLCATEGPYVANPAIESSAYFEIVGMSHTKY